MLQHTFQLVSDLLAQAPTTAPADGDGKPVDPSTIINSAGILTAIIKIAVPILLAFLGVVFMGRARRGRVAEIATSSVSAIWGLCFIAGAPVIYLLAPKIVTLILGN